MKAEEILKDVESGLTGEIKSDMDYLAGCMKKYSELEDFEVKKEVLKGVQQMMFRVSPEEAKRIAGRSLAAMQAHYKNILDIAMGYTKERNADKVIETLEPEIERFERDEKGYEDTDEVEHFVFTQPMETVLYKFKFKTNKKILRPVEPVTDFYFLYGVAKKVKGDNDAAIDALSKASRWNPVACGIWLEYADYIRERGDLDTFMEIVEKAFEYAFLPGDLARCYAAFSRFFFERGHMEIAIACMQMSFMFVKKPNPFATIMYKEIEKQVEPEALKPKSVAQIAEILKKSKIPYTPDKDVIGLAFTHGKKCLESGEKRPALYYLRIVFNLTHDPKVEELIKEAEALPDEA